MGLDSVELVMEFEDEFETSIPDAVAENMRTIGDFVKYIASANGIAPEDTASVQDIRHRVCLIVAEQMGVEYSGLSDETRFVQDLGVN
jgi:acyl carrier protein